MSDDFEDLQEIEPSGPGSDESDDALGRVLKYYWRLLRDYYWVLLITTLIGAGAAYFWTQRQPEQFEASSKIIFHQSQGNVFGRKIEQVELMDPGDRWEFEQFWNSQKQVFKARWFAEKVVERVGLMNNADFREAFVPSNSTEDSELTRDQAVDRVLQMFQVELHRDSRVAVIRVESKNPELASALANGIANTYIEYTKDFQSGGLKDITSWFDSYVASKREELESAQSKLQKFKRKNNILSFSYEDRQNLTASNMESVNTDLMDVRTELSSQQALLKQVQRMQKKNETKAIAELLDSETLRKAYQSKADLEKGLAELETNYLTKHPKVQAKQNQLKTVQENINEEIKRKIAGIRNEVQLLKEKKQNLESELSRLKEDVFKLNELGVKYTQLKDRTENLKELYDTVLKRSSELNINSMYQGNEIEVLEEATTPENPVSPSLPFNLAIGIFLGLSSGCIATIVLDALDTTVKSEDDVAEYTDKPTLAMLPKLDDNILDGLEVIGQTAADTVTFTAPKSSFAEGIKTLRTNLTFMSPDKPPETMLVTSPGPGEGKTVTATNMAIAMAQSGVKTLLVDTDLRRPRMHSALDLDRAPGLTDIVTDGIDLETAVQSTVVENLHGIASGEVPPNPSEMLHSERFKEFLQSARNSYDRVIFDSPPLAAVSDALILSNLVDGVLLIVEFGKTRRETLERSLEQLHGIGAPLLGCVLNEVSQDSRGYGYSYYRYSYYGDEDRGDDTRLAS